MQCKTINSHVKSILSTKILFSNISFFFSKFCPTLFAFILFYFILLIFFFRNFFCDEQCSFSDSGTVLSLKTELGAPGAHPKPRLHAQACVPAQASICHNTAEPIVCLLSLLYATIQPSLLCACLTFYMPQYSRAYYMPAQAAVCQLRPVYACLGCCMPAKVVVCLLRPLYACSGCCSLLRLLYACSGCCMSAKAVLCLLRLLLP